MLTESNAVIAPVLPQLTRQSLEQAAFPQLALRTSYLTYATFSVVPTTVRLAQLKMQ